MIDLHTHTVFSDGVLIPFELVRRAEAAGYKGLAITDHADYSNISLILPRLNEALEKLRPMVDMSLLAGVELTHVPPPMIRELVEKARELGAQIVVMHGETLVEPVKAGTNRAAIEAGVDILAHPGLITDEDAARAAELGVCLEITTRKGHSLSNGHVATAARRAGARLVIDNDAHEPSDLVSRDQMVRIGLGAGLSPAEVEQAFANSREIIEKASGRT